MIWNRKNNVEMTLKTKVSFWILLFDLGRFNAFCQAWIWSLWCMMLASFRFVAKFTSIFLFLMFVFLFLTFSKHKFASNLFSNLGFFNYLTLKKYLKVVNYIGCSTCIYTKYQGCLFSIYFTFIICVLIAVFNRYCFSCIKRSLLCSAFDFIAPSFVEAP